MACGSCSTGGCTPAGCKSNGSCLTGGGCSKLDVYDWLSDMDLPANYKPLDIVEVRFKGSRKEFYKNDNNLYLEIAEPVVVETGLGGYDIGHITAMGEMVRLQMNKKGVKSETQEFKKIYRKANTIDMDKWRTAKTLEVETMYRARTIAIQLGLQMKLSDVEFQGDKMKATFFYTAEERVDFRELIKVMAEEFKVRIEMRQIGIRQEASRLGGIGSCGRELCCTTWLTDFKNVSTSAARYQNLSINTQKLAGQCGKLKCCLNFELDTYMDALKDIPSDIREIVTAKGAARLQKTDIFKRLMWFAYKHSDPWIPLTVDKVKELAAQNKGGTTIEDIEDMAFISAKEIEEEEKIDYMNVVGQDSLTRLDNKNKKKGNKNNNSNKNRNPNQGPRPERTEGNDRPIQSANARNNNNRRPAQANNAPAEGTAPAQKINNNPRNNRPPNPNAPKNDGVENKTSTAEGTPNAAPKPNNRPPQNQGNRNNNNRNSSPRPPQNSNEPKPTSPAPSEN